eukprot:754498-Hanusia_phi.AAC.3
MCKEEGSRIRENGAAVLDEETGTSGEEGQEEDAMIVNREGEGRGGGRELRWRNRTKKKGLDGGGR